jgi:SAM-dependent methyltransferase
MRSDYVWPHLAELPAFRALIRSIEHRLLREQKPFASPVLDVGIGDGHFASVALGPSLDVGIDVDWSTMREAQQRRVYHAIVAASATAMPFPCNYFATIISNCVIEHIPDLPATLSEMHRILRPGGMLLLTVPTDRLESNLLFPGLLRAIRLNEFAARYLAWFRKVQVHYHLLSRECWVEALRSAGFQVERQRGYMSARATKFFELGHYTGILNLLARRLTGRWVLWPWRPRFFILESLLSRFVMEPEHSDDSCLFMAAHK